MTASIISWEKAMLQRNEADVESNLESVVEDAVNGTPCTIMRDGEPAVVIVSHAEWLRLSGRQSIENPTMSAPSERDDVPKRDQTPPK